MPTPQTSRPRLYAAMIALCVVPGLAFVALIPWMKQQPDDVVFLITGVTVTVVILACLGLDLMLDRGMDEWQRSNARFSVKWGWALGCSLVALLLAFPAFHDLILHWAAIWGDEPNPDRRLVLVTFTFGFMSVVIAQTLFTALASIGWTLWKSRPARAS